MSEFSEIETFINDYRSKHPRTRYYPKEFWVRVLPLAREHGVAKVATALGISQPHLSKKLRQSSNVKDTQVGDHEVAFLCSSSPVLIGPSNHLGKGSINY